MNNLPEFPIPWIRFWGGPKVRVWVGVGEVHGDVVVRLKVYHP